MSNVPKILNWDRAFATSDPIATYHPVNLPEICIRARKRSLAIGSAKADKRRASDD